MALDKKAASGKRALFGPVSVGVLLLLFGAGMMLMSGGGANPALVLLIALIGAGCVWWGLRQRAG